MRRWTIPILVLLVVAIFVWSQQHAATPVPVASEPAASTSRDAAPTSPQPTSAPGAASPSVALPADSLPPEVAGTLTLIQHGGPFAHRQDGVVFQNRERLLPSKSNGYYHEYTVPTPGAGDRGARRIITGGDPPSVYYYTDDHYRSFRTLEVAR